MFSLSLGIVPLPKHRIDFSDSLADGGGGGGGSVAPKEDWTICTRWGRYVFHNADPDPGGTGILNQINVLLFVRIRQLFVIVYKKIKWLVFQK